MSRKQSTINHQPSTIKLQPSILAGALLALAPQLLAAGAGASHQSSIINHPSEVLQVHLPREVTVPGNLLTLGQVAVLRGDPALAAQAAGIGLGQLSVPGQKAVVDRTTILSRLSVQGIGAEQVRLTGAEAVAVRRHQKVISAEEFIELGRMLLQQHPPGPSICEAIPTIRPKDLILPGPVEDLQVTPRYVRTAARGQVTVQIAVTADGKECGVREVPFRLKYQCRRVVAAVEIPEGTVLTPENLKIETIVSDQPEPSNWRPPYGLVAVRTLAAETEVRREMLGSSRPAALISRNETVVIRIQRPGLLVTAMGTALQEARAGEYVKVRNADSNRIVLCKVSEDGTVEPIM